MIPCCFLTNAEIVLGDINKNSIVDILKGEEMQVLQNVHSCGEFDGLPCKMCDQRNEGDHPLLYSNRDELMEVGRLSTSKVKVTDS